MPLGRAAPAEAEVLQDPRSLDAEAAGRAERRHQPLPVEAIGPGRAGQARKDRYRQDDHPHGAHRHLVANVQAYARAATGSVCMLTTSRDGEGLRARRRAPRA
jgi:hypothetical protein